MLDNFPSNRCGKRYKGYSLRKYSHNKLNNVQSGQIEQQTRQLYPRDQNLTAFNSRSTHCKKKFSIENFFIATNFPMN